MAKAKTTLEALEWVAKLALRDPSGRPAVQKLIRAAERERGAGEDDGTVAMLKAALDPGPERRRGRPPVSALVKGTGLTDPQKRTVRQIDTLWQEREALAAPPGGTFAGMKVDGGKIGRAPQEMGGRPLGPDSLAYSPWLHREVFDPWLRHMHGTGLLTRQPVEPGGGDRTMYEMLHSLFVHGVGLRSMERLAGVRNGGLKSALTWALDQFERRRKNAARAPG